MQDKIFHYYDIKTEDGMPAELKHEYHKNGYKGSIDGFMRRRTTIFMGLVTCKLCLREIKKQKLKSSYLDEIMPEILIKNDYLIPEIKKYFKIRRLKITTSGIQRFFKLGYDSAYYLHQCCS